VQGFTSANQFAHYHMLIHLSPALREIFASDDSDFAKLFSNYMSPPASTPAKTVGPVAEGPRPTNTTTKK